MDQVFMGGAVQPEARFPIRPRPSLEYPAPLPDAVLASQKCLLGSELDPDHERAAEQPTSGHVAWRALHGYTLCELSVSESRHHQFGFGVLTVTPFQANDTPPFYDPEHGRGFIGVMNAITVSGEWIWQNGTLYIQTPHGQIPSSTIIEAKARELAFNLTGKSYINIKKLEIFSAGLTMYNGSNNTIDGAKFSYIHQRDRPANGAGPNDSMRSLSGIYLGGHHNTIKNSIIAYSSGSCVTLLGV